MIWFTSDTHFSHKNIIDYCNRPYKNIEEMNEALVENWNECVAPNDSVFHLGDVCMGAKDTVDKYVPRLNGEVMVIQGNHDYNRRKDDMREYGWEVVNDYMFRYQGITFYLTHNPENKNVKDIPAKAVILYGHVHDSAPCGVHKINGHYAYHVGIDTNDYKPVSLKTIYNDIIDYVMKVNNED